jgi:hypothetical protein
MEASRAQLYDPSSPGASETLVFSFATENAYVSISTCPCYLRRLRRLGKVGRVRPALRTGITKEMR